MSRIVKIAKTLRRNWKKSTFGFAVLSYGISYGFQKYRTFQLMRAYCEEAKKYGDQPLAKLERPRHVTVILNPEANDKKAKVRYEKYAAPLLHLAGLKVSLFITENAGQATDLMEIMENTDAVIIAGGNGTLLEAVTGFLRRPDYTEKVASSLPFGILPLGKTNTVAKVLFNSKSSNEAEWLAEAAMSVVRESTQSLDVLKVEIGEDKPLFALSGVEYGVFPSIEMNIGSYWYFGPLKARVAFFMNFLKRFTSEDVDMEYIMPCDGCSKCFGKSAPRPTAKKESTRWWSAFVPKERINSDFPVKDYSKIINDNCGIRHSKSSSFSNMFIATGLQYFHSLNSPQKAFWITTFPSGLTFSDFYHVGLQYHDGQVLDYPEISNTFTAKEVNISLKEAKETFCFVDKEKYDIQPLCISLLPKHLTVYG